MVDIETGRIIDILESREMEDVSKWLKEYPNIKYVSRDGSPTYASAISKAFPNAVQISDRFHLIKNLCESAIQSFQKLFKGRIEIPVTEKTAMICRTILEKNSVSEKYRIAKKLYAEGKTYTEISAVLKVATRTIQKYVNTPDEEIPEDKLTKRGIEHKNAVNKIQEKIALVKSLKDKGNSVYQIVRETGFTRNIVNKYLSPDATPINGQYGNSRPGVLYPYREEVIQLLSKGLTYEQTAEKIRNRGYTGSVAAIRGFISKERRLGKDMKSSDNSTKTEFVEKKWLKQLIFKDLVNVKGITEEQLMAVIQKYPIVSKIYDTVRAFKKIIFAKKADELPKWITETEKLGIEEFNSFINGLKRDHDAVLNAISLDYNNGRAEGSVNKLKLIKRIMYGRNSFKMLRYKVLKLECFNTLYH